MKPAEHRLPKPLVRMGLIVTLVVGALGLASCGGAPSKMPTVAPSPSGGATVGQKATALALSPNGLTAYVAFDPTTGSPGFQVVNVKSGDVEATVTLPGTAAAMAISSDGSTAWVACGPAGGTPPQPGEVVPISLKTDTVGSSIPAGYDPAALALTPNQQELVVANADTAADNSTGAITLISVAQRRVTDTIADPDPPIAIATTPDGTGAWLANSDDTATRLALNSDTLGPAIDIPEGGQPGSILPSPDGHPDAIAITPNGARVLVLSEGDWAYGDTGTVTPINASTGAVGTAIAIVGRGADGVDDVAISAGPASTTALVLVEGGYLPDYPGQLQPSSIASVDLTTGRQTSAVSAQFGSFLMAVPTMGATAEVVGYSSATSSTNVLFAVKLPG